MADNTLDSLETRIRGLEGLLNETEKRLTTIDQLQAVIITMYAEMFAGIEALASVIADDDEETAKKLSSRRDEAVQALWKVLGQQVQSDVEDMDDSTSAAMENFVRGTPVNSD